MPKSANPRSTSMVKMRGWEVVLQVLALHFLGS
jgi:hypothetical protein